MPIEQAQSQVGNLERKRELLLKQRDLLKARDNILSKQVPTVQEPKMTNQQKAEKRIVERGKLDPEKALFQLAKEGAGPKIKGSLELVADPMKRAEAIMANPMIELQEGDFASIPSSILAGIKGTRLGEFGDVYVGAGVPEPIANTLGLATDIVLTGGLIEQGIKGARKGIMKGADLLSLKGVDDILVGVDRATDASIVLTNKFWEKINKVPAQLSDDALEGLSRIPKAALNEVEEQLGKRVDQISNLADLRKIKQVLGEMKPNEFGKFSLGLTETIQGQKVVKAYASVAKTIENTLKSAKNIDPKLANQLMATNNSAEMVINGSNIIRRALTGKSGRKVEPAIGAAIKRGGAEFRQQLKNLSQVAPGARKMIQRGLVTLRNIAARDATAKLISGIGRTVFVGGLAGQVAGRIARKGTNIEGSTPVE